MLFQMFSSLDMVTPLETLRGNEHVNTYICFFCCIMDDTERLQPLVDLQLGNLD